MRDGDLEASGRGTFRPPLRGVFSRPAARIEQGTSTIWKSLKSHGFRLLTLRHDTTAPRSFLGSSNEKAIIKPLETLGNEAFHGGQNDDLQNVDV